MKNFQCLLLSQAVDSTGVSSAGREVISLKALTLLVQKNSYFCSAVG